MILIKNGHVIDPFNKIDGEFDILIEGRSISKIGRGLDSKNAEVYDASNKIVTPGLIDMHCHLREPGREDEEKISTGTKSAALGGFTAIACMPNTEPAIDNLAVIKLVYFLSEKEGVVKVYPIAAITKNRAGEELTEIGDLHKMGAVAVSDDGSPIMNAEIMRRALEYTKMFGIPVISHCEDLNLSKGGMINEGYTSTVCGLIGIPNASEEVMVTRDVILAELTGGKLHIAHVSTAGSVSIIRDAKKRGIKVTAEVCPHHFSLTDEATANYDSNTKVNPPLRSKKDIEALIEGLKDNTIDCIATDHAPHTLFEKEQEFNYAPFGIIGLETAIPLTITNLVDKGKISLQDAVEKFTQNPAQILSLPSEGIKSGAPADVTVIDPNMELIYNKEDIISKSKNSPFIGMKLKGFPTLTVVDGRIIMKDRKILV